MLYENCDFNFDLPFLLGDDSLYFQSRQLEANDEYAERKVAEHSV